VYGFLCSRLIKRNALSYFPCFIFDDHHSPHALSSGPVLIASLPPYPSILPPPRKSSAFRGLGSMQKKTHFSNFFFHDPHPLYHYCTSLPADPDRRVGNRMSCRKGINDKHTRQVDLPRVLSYAMLSQLEARHHRGKIRLRSGTIIDDDRGVNGGNMTFLHARVPTSKDHSITD